MCGHLGALRMRCVCLEVRLDRMIKKTSLCMIYFKGLQRDSFHHWMISIHLSWKQL